MPMLVLQKKRPCLFWLWIGEQIFKCFQAVKRVMSKKHAWKETWSETQVTRLP
jgi:hypothetical protein